MHKLLMCYVNCLNLSTQNTKGIPTKQDKLNGKKGKL